MRSRDWLAVGALTLLGAALRFATLDLQSYWFDEALTATILKRDFAGMLDGVHDTQLTPHAYYVLAWLWAKVFGTGEVGLRALSALAGTALVPLAYAIGRAAATRRAGVVLAALAATSPLLVWYSQEARPYSLLLLLGGLSLLAFLRLLRDGHDGRVLAAWSAASALALATHYFALFLVVPEAALLLARLPRRGVVAAASLPVAAVGIAYLPLALFQRTNIGTGYIAGFPLIDRLGWLLRDALAGVAFHVRDGARLDDLLTLAALPALALALWALMRRASREERAAAAAPALLAGAVLATALLLAAVGLDYVNTRNMVLLWLPAALVVAIGLALPRSRPWGAAAAVWLCLIGLAGIAYGLVEPERWRNDWRGVSEVLGPARLPRAVAVPPVDGEVTLGYYRPRLRRLPRAGAPVREIALAAVRSPGTSTAPGRAIAAPPPPLPGFRLVRADAGKTFLAFRYRSPRAVMVRPRDLADAAPWLGRPAVLLEPPRP
jgi:hypothetical protein